MFGGELLKVGAHQASERRVAFDGNFASFLNEIIVDSKRDVHQPIIRETSIWASGPPLRSSQPADYFALLNSASLSAGFRVQTLCWVAVLYAHAKQAQSFCVPRRTPIFGSSNATPRSY